MIKNRVWNKKRIACYIMLIIFVFGLVIGCSSSNEPTALKLDGETIELNVGEDKSIAISLEPEDADDDTLVYEVGDDAIASFVKDQESSIKGLLKALKEGDTYIYVTSKGDVKSNWVNVHVIDKTKEEQRKKEATNIIDAIQKIGDVSLDSKNVLSEVRENYNKLDDNAKKLVTNENVLKEAEQAYQNKVAEAEAQKQEQAKQEEQAKQKEQAKQEQAKQEQAKQKEQAKQEQAKQKEQAEQAQQNTSNQNNSATVYWTPNGEKYHASSSCSTLKRSKTILSGTIGEAQGIGKGELCKVCGR